MDKKVPLPQEITSRFSVKGVKNGFGHDLMGLFADIYLDNKKIGYYNDDGWGGEVDLHLTSTADTLASDLCDKVNMAQLLYDNGWAFMGSPDKITRHTQIEQIFYTLIDAVLTKKEAAAFIKKMRKDFLTAIVVGVPDSGKYSVYRMPNKVTIDRLMNHVNGKGQLRGAIMVIKGKLQAGEVILNDNLGELVK